MKESVEVDFPKTKWESLDYEIGPKKKKILRSDTLTYN